MSDDPVLQVSNLSVRFGDVLAVDDVSFTVGRGEVVAIVGKSGCGKSVTAMSLLGLAGPTATVGGSARFGDLDLLGADDAALRGVRGRELSMVFQEPMTSLNPVLTVGRQVGEVLRRHLGLSRAEARTRSIELLELVGIPAAEQRLRAYPHQLSGGMRQRVMIAIAVACDPAVLIADEPTTALDVTIQAGVLDLVRDLRERLGTAIVLITHDLGVVADVADRVVVMYAGRTVEEAPVGELFAAPQHPYTLGLLGAVPRPGDDRARLAEIPGQVPARSGPATSCVFAPRCPRADDDCRSRVPPYEAVRPAHPVACFHPGAREAVPA